MQKEVEREMTKGFYFWLLVYEKRRWIQTDQLSCQVWISSSNDVGSLWVLQI